MVSDIFRQLSALLYFIVYFLYFLGNDVYFFSFLDLGFDVPYVLALYPTDIFLPHFAGINRYVEVYDWLKWRGNFLRASFDSQIVGKNVCSALAEAEKQQGEIKHLHVIGVSVGAFAADSCIKVFNKAG